METLDKIKDLQEKQAKAQTASTRLATQLEALEEEQKRLESQLAAEFSITFEQVESELEKLAEQQAKLLADAEKKLAKINR
jgi:hypothetical protein